MITRPKCPIVSRFQCLSSKQHVASIFNHQAAMFPIISLLICTNRPLLVLELLSDKKKNTNDLQISASGGVNTDLGD